MRSASSSFQPRRAWRGGASKEKVYDAARIVEAPPTRLFVDAHSASEWRARGFHPVLNERDQTAAANLQASVLFRMLDLKRRHPLPGDRVLPETFDFSLNRSQQCAGLE